MKEVFCQKLTDFFGLKPCPVPLLLHFLLPYGAEYCPCCLHEGEYHRVIFLDLELQFNLMFVSCLCLQVVNFTKVTIFINLKEDRYVSPANRDDLPGNYRVFSGNIYGLMLCILYSLRASPRPLITPGLPSAIYAPRAFFPPFIHFGPPLPPPPPHLLTPGLPSPLIYSGPSLRGWDGSTVTAS